ncbi:hypothetical protein HPB50_023668 [Hyalomma asiaticum]|uniref:Uncharacterized protein n=1 Tax=Hyalomma asiaticum TaxID=266040 RepID=A0ACB7T6F3_HYAAI|nr:hypothetical protein HPB50_023668 [Hyalomma asiaticum]
MELPSPVLQDSSLFYEPSLSIDAGKKSDALKHHEQGRPSADASMRTALGQPESEPPISRHSFLPADFSSLQRKASLKEADDVELILAEETFTQPKFPAFVV